MRTLGETCPNSESRVRAICAMMICEKKGVWTMSKQQESTIRAQGRDDEQDLSAC